MFLQIILVGMDSDPDWTPPGKRNYNKYSAASESNSKQIPVYTRFYVVYRGRNPGIYASRGACIQQTKDYTGSWYEATDTLEKAKNLFSSYLERQARLEDQKNIKDFFNPGLPEKIFVNLNGSWKAHIQEDNILYRQFMGRLADAIHDEIKIRDQRFISQKDKNETSQKNIFELLKTLEWGENYNPTHVDLLLELTENEYPKDLEIWQLRKLCLFYKAQKDLPYELFRKITQYVDDTDQQVKDLFKYFENNVFYDGDIPKLFVILDTTLDDQFLDQLQAAIGWGLVRSLIIDIDSFYLLKWIPLMYKTMIYKYLVKYKNFRYFTIKITSTLGWREREKYFRPYQIWELEKTNLEDLEDTTPAHELGEFNILKYAAQCLVDIQEEAHNAMKPEQIRVSHERLLFLTDFQKIEVIEEMHLEASLLMNKLQNRIELDTPMEVEVRAEELSREYAEREYQLQHDHQLAEAQFEAVIFAHLEQLEAIHVVELPPDDIDADPMDAMVPDVDEPEPPIPETAVNNWVNEIIVPDVAIPEPGENETGGNNLME